MRMSISESLSNLQPMSIEKTLMINDDVMSLETTTVTENGPEAMSIETTPVLQAPVEVSRTLNSYDLIQKLGAGAQGSVYKAIIKETGQVIALKILNVQDEGVFKQARIEVANLIRISTPNCNPYISCYYGSYYDANVRQMLIEMEYIEGEDLDSWAAKFRNAGEYTALNYRLLAIIVRLSSALQYVHSNNLIHRDIKPANILITRDDQPKLVDFGIACETNLCPINATYKPCCRGRAGTPIFMSPEIVSTGKSFFASDV